MGVNRRSEAWIAVRRKLNGWKAIASHLEHGRRTVQRWHTDFGLPIHRIGGDRGQVFAYVGEIEAWIESRSPQPARECENAKQKDSPAGLSSNRANGSPAYRVPASDHLQAVELVALALRKGRVLSNGNLQPIASLLRAAVDLDPFHAEGLAWYAAVMLAQDFWGDQPASNSLGAARSVLEQAAQLDPASITLRALTGWMHLLSDRNWRRAGSLFEEVLRAAPRNAIALMGSAVLHVTQKRLPQASEIFAGMMEDNPLMACVIAQSAWVDYLSENYEKAMARLVQARRAGCAGCPFDILEALCLLQVKNGDRTLERIEDLSRNSPHCAVLAGALGRAYSAAGFVAKAGEILALLDQREGPGSNDRFYAAALVYIGLGETQKAREALQACFQSGSIWSFALHCDPALAPLRDDPDFRRFLNRIDYPAGGDPLRRRIQPNRRIQRNNAAMKDPGQSHPPAAELSRG